MTFLLFVGRGKTRKVGIRAARRERKLVSEDSTTVKLSEDLRISQDYASPMDPNPRAFSKDVKRQCWNKAAQVKGRDPARWRKDALGNIVFRNLVDCPGCLCHNYDHIIPFSKGGKSTLENCQILQSSVNKVKGNQTDISRLDLMKKSSYCHIEDSEMDILERFAYGNIWRAPEDGGCTIQ